MSDTLIGFLYRDASNYKRWNVLGVHGTFTAQQKQDILDALDDGLFFIPEQVGWPAIRIEPYTEDDTEFCELEADGFETVPDLTGSHKPDFIFDQTPEEIADAFRQAKKEGWKPWEYGPDFDTILEDEEDDRDEDNEEAEE